MASSGNAFPPLSARGRAARRGPPHRWVPRSRYFLALVLVLVMFGGADSMLSAQPPRWMDPESVSAHRVEVPTGQAARSVRAVDAWSAEHPQMTVGTAVWDRRTEEFVTGNSGGERMYSASLVKLFIAADVLRRAHDGLVVSGQAREKIVAALSASDDEAMNALWTTYDGPGAVRRVADHAGLTDSHPPADPDQWGETVISARDMTRVFRYVIRDLPRNDRDFIMRSLAAAPAKSASGFDQRFGLGKSPSGAVKLGWMCCPDDRITLHSAGTTGNAGRYVVTLLSNQSPDVGYVHARHELTEVARAALRPLR